MVNSGMRVGGGVCFWTLAQWANRDKLLDGLTDLGQTKLCPPVRSVQQCLRSALQAAFKRHIIQPLKGGGLEIREVVHLDDDNNDHVLKLTARIDEQERISLNPYKVEWAGEIQNQYRAARGQVSADAVADMMVRYLDGLGGTKLRPMGGIYWLRDEVLPNWQQLTRIVENAASKGQSRGYLIRHDMDHDSIIAVRDAIVAEVTATAQTLHDEVVSGTLGERALHSREAQAQELREKILLYESLLGQGLQSLHNAVDTAEQAAAAACILASGASGV